MKPHPYVLSYFFFSFPLHLSQSHSLLILGHPLVRTLCTYNFTSQLQLGAGSFDLAITQTKQFNLIKFGFSWVTYKRDMFLRKNWVGLFCVLELGRIKGEKPSLAKIRQWIRRKKSVTCSKGNGLIWDELSVPYYHESECRYIPWLPPQLNLPRTWTVGQGLPETEMAGLMLWSSQVSYRICMLPYSLFSMHATV